MTLRKKEREREKKNDLSHHASVFHKERQDSNVFFYLLRCMARALVGWVWRRRGQKRRDRGRGFSFFRFLTDETKRRRGNRRRKKKPRNSQKNHSQLNDTDSSTTRRTEENLFQIGFDRHDAFSSSSFSSSRPLHPTMSNDPTRAALLAQLDQRSALPVNEENLWLRFSFFFFFKETFNSIDKTWTWFYNLVTSLFLINLHRKLSTISSRMKPETIRNVTLWRYTISDVVVSDERIFHWPWRKRWIVFIFRFGFYGIYFTTGNACSVSEIWDDEEKEMINVWLRLGNNELFGYMSICQVKKTRHHH